MPRNSEMSFGKKQLGLGAIVDANKSSLKLELPNNGISRKTLINSARPGSSQLENVAGTPRSTIKVKLPLGFKTPLGLRTPKGSPRRLITPGGSPEPKRLITPRGSPKR